MTVNLFDVDFYRSAYADLAGFSDQQLTEHFQTFGLNEGRSFSPLADLSYYRANNSDLSRLSQTDLFDHLANNGVAEGRRFSPFVDLNFYRLANQDLDELSLDNEELFTNLQDSGIAEGRQFSAFVDLGFYRLANSDLSNLTNDNLLNHLVLFGAGESRRYSPYVDLGFYLRNNPDLAPLQGSQRLALEHLQATGLAEGRRFSPLVDLGFYRLANPNLVALNLSNVDLLNRIETVGIAQDERFSLAYESSFYRSDNPDLQFANLSNQDLFEHFQVFGLTEGRASADSFDVTLYRDNSPDLIAANFNNAQALEHFSSNGFREPRLASRAAFTVSQDPPDALSSAANLGVINNRVAPPLSQSLGNGDRDDIYRFTIGSSNRVTISLNSLGGTAQAQLFYDRNVNFLIESDEIIEVGSLGQAFSFSQDLAPGTYYVNVSTPRTDTVVNYSLGLSATSLPITTNQDAGETLTTALNLGSVSNPLVLQDFIGISDPADVYRFDVGVNSSVDISIDGLNGTDTVDAQLIFDSNSNGQIETEFISSDRSNTSIFLGKNLGVGTYYIRLQPETITQGSAYTLRLASTPLAPPSTGADPGNSFTTAFNLGFLQSNVSLTQFVGTSDRQDVYRFILSTGANPSQTVRVNLDSLTDSVGAQLVFDRNGNNLLDSGDTVTNLGRSTSAIASTQNLESGNYFVIVSSANFQSNTNYRLLINT